MSFDVELRRAREALGQARADTPPADPRPEATGAAYEDQVRVVAAGARVTSVVLTDRAMKLFAEDLSGHLTEAVNAALDGLRAPDTEDAGGVPDPGALAQRMREVEAYGLRMMETIGRSVDEAVDRVRDRTGMHGDAGGHGLAALFAQSLETLRQVSAAIEGPEMPDGTGESADGRIQVLARGGGRVEVTLDPRVLRLPAEETAGHVMLAVNAALDDRDAKAAGAPAPSTVDTEELARSVRRAQDMSLEHMQRYTGAVRQLMSSIGEPPVRGGIPAEREDGG